MAERHFILKQCCCCCCSLRTGCIVIAVLSFIANIAGMASTTYLAITDNTYHPLMLSNARYWIDFTLCVFAFIATIFLSHGINGKHGGCLWLFFYIEVVLCSVRLNMFVILLILGTYSYEAIPYFFFTALDIYYILVVRSYAYEVDDQKRESGRINLSEVESPIYKQ